MSPIDYEWRPPRQLCAFVDGGLKSSPRPVVWRKKGCIFEAGGKRWMHSHAALPTMIHNNIGSVDVYFCSRDASSRSQIGRFSLDPVSGEVTRVSSRALLEPGLIGTFDDSGVTPASIMAHNNCLYLFYTGWMLGRTVPFYYSVGLAISDDGGESFQRVSRGPILERNDIDPYLAASPCVLLDQGLWRMWYVSGVRWESRPEGPRHYYHIRYAESQDGISWQRDGRVCIDFESESEYAIARPTVVKDASIYHMWFPHRGNSYRIGYAESPDGLTWTRKDEKSGIDVSVSGWDGEMVTYPCVFDHKGRRYMLYNGNGYGRSGIGLAEQFVSGGSDT